MNYFIFGKFTAMRPITWLRSDYRWADKFKYDRQGYRWCDSFRFRRKTSKNKQEQR